jgi:NAD(P)-dependent dehydrogenase (short-subunit alcohol dehydrogenase family)
MNAREMFELTGKVALVTGGSRGLGLQMAHGLGEMGAKVAITARSEDELAAASSELETAGTTVVAIPHDLSELERIGPLVDRVVDELGDVDILVNNASVAITAPAEDHAHGDWNRVMDLNLNALFLLTRGVGRRCMIPRRRGKVINISSVGALGGPALDTFMASYCASKGAVISLTRALATEWGRYNINVNAIAPGYFPSKMTAGALPSGHHDRVISKSPLGRVCGEHDLKGVAVFFASEASRHLTGQYVVLDGGASTTLYPTVSN